MTAGPVYQGRTRQQGSHNRWPASPPAGGGRHFSSWMRKVHKVQRMYGWYEKHNGRIMHGIMLDDLRVIAAESS